MIGTTANEKGRLSAIANTIQTFFDGNNISAQALVGSTVLTPPQVMDKIYIYVNPAKYHKMCVDSHYFEQREDEDYNFYISASYHASYSIDVYGKDYDAFDSAKTLLSLFFTTNYPSLRMAFMDADEILNLTDTNLSDSLVFQRFKFVAHFMQNDIINIGVITSIDEVKVQGMLSNVKIDVIVREDGNRYIQQS